MSDESALAVQVAENQAGEAPDSGGKSGDAAADFRQRNPAQALCPGGAHPPVKGWPGPACRECMRPAEGAEVMPPHVPSPPADVVFWWLATLKSQVGELWSMRQATLLKNKLKGKTDIEEVRERIDGLASSQQALEVYMDELKSRISVAEKAQQELAARLDGAARDWQELRCKVEKLAALSEERASGERALGERIRHDRMALDDLRRLVDARFEQLGCDLGHAAARIVNLEALARGPGAVFEALKMKSSGQATGPEKWAELLGPDVAEEPIVTSHLDIWRYGPPSVGERQVLVHMVRDLVRELHRARMELFQQALKGFTAEFRESLQREQPGGFEGLDRQAVPLAEVRRANPGGMTAEDFRKAAEKEQPGRLVQPFERQAKPLGGDE